MDRDRPQWMPHFKPTAKPLTSMSRDELRELLRSDREMLRYLLSTVSEFSPFSLMIYDLAYLLAETDRLRAALEKIAARAQTECGANARGCCTCDCDEIARDALGGK